MRIVTGAAHCVVRLGLRVEIRQPLPHLMAPQTFLLSRYEQRARSVETGLLGHRHGELVAQRAVHVGLIAHPGEPNLRLLVAGRLATSGIGGHELVHGETVAGHALDVAQ